jgi:hypothetical protein
MKDIRAKLSSALTELAKIAEKHSNAARRSDDPSNVLPERGL